MGFNLSGSDSAEPDEKICACLGDPELAAETEHLKDLGDGGTVRLAFWI
jgi:hypothetical protein